MVQKMMKNGGKIDGFSMLQKNVGLPLQNGWFQKMINALAKLDDFKSGPQTHEK